LLLDAVHFLQYVPVVVGIGASQKTCVCRMLWPFTVMAIISWHDVTQNVSVYEVTQILLQTIMHLFANHLPIHNNVFQIEIGRCKATCMMLA
jgi:aconitase B